MPPELTDKEIRYAMIKGWIERKYPERRPDYCKPDLSMVLLADEIYKDNENYDERCS